MRDFSREITIIDEGIAQAADQFVTEITIPPVMPRQILSIPEQQNPDCTFPAVGIFCLTFEHPRFIIGIYRKQRRRFRCRDRSEAGESATCRG